MKKHIENKLLTKSFLNKFSNYFSYVAKTITFFSAIFILGLNINAFIYPSTWAKDEVATSPNNLELHYEFIDFLLSINDYRSVKREIEIIKSLFGEVNKVAEYEHTIERLERKPAEIKQEIVKLQQLTIDRKDYRDAYLKLAVLSWQVYEEDKARAYLSRALELDPNYEESLRFESIVNGE